MNDINLENVSPEIAKELKDIGFDDPCYGSYSIALKSRKHDADGYSGPFGWKKGEITFDKSYFINFWKQCDYSNSSWLQVAAPLYQQAFRWFRDKHRLYGKIDQYYGKRFYVKIESYDETYTLDELRDLGEYSTYEEAQDACINKMINLIKNKKNENQSPS